MLMFSHNSHLKVKLKNVNCTKRETFLYILLTTDKLKVNTLKLYDETTIEYTFKK